MDYNSKRKKLALPEYGRNVQNMVDYLLTIEDRDKRNKSAQNVIDVMGNLYPFLRDVPEFNHKLWDHLAIMSDFQLDIDYPYELPEPEALLEKPKKIAYNQHSIKYRHYGLTVERLIKEAERFEGEERKIIIEQIANHMKKSFLNWNKSSVDDKKIFEDLKEMSHGKLIPEPDLQLAEGRILIARKKKQNNKKKK